jgi:hypothetical protein
MTGAIAAMIKLFPYLIGMRLVTGTIDIAVHAIKLKITKSQGPQ